ncbi:zinc finger BED domain-containing protein 4-like [Anoplolepis gracilipes]|uniref:zinc finger BED domain-containing protein 4-like n=1 Tax=Anoplolepis gracilipes TaxID=354296 RepID=UPI003BA13D06
MPIPQYSYPGIQDKNYDLFDGVDPKHPETYGYMVELRCVTTYEGLFYQHMIECLKICRTCCSNLSEEQKLEYALVPPHNLVHKNSAENQRSCTTSEKPIDISSKMSKCNSSPIWTYFLLSDTDHAKCKICNKLISRKGRTTSAMRNHIKSIHKEEFRNLENIENQKREELTTLSNLSPHQTSGKNELKQSFIVECIERTKKWDNKNSKSLQIDQLVSEMIALEDLPFNFVESLGFGRLIQHLCLPYNLKTHQYFTFLCDKIYSRVEEKVKELLTQFEIYMSLLSLTCHGITRYYERKLIILKAEIFNDGRHTGENIAAKIEKMLSFWGIPMEKVLCIIRDSGSNMKKSMSLLHVKDIDCTAHQIQLIVKDGINAQEMIVDLIKKRKKIAMHFHHSNTAQDELKALHEKLDQPKLHVLQDCSTRWNSTFYMIQRILQTKDSLCLYASSNHKIPQLTSHDWVVLEKLIYLLKPFEEITRELSSANVSISSVIPLISSLKKIIDSLDETDREIGKNICVLKHELVRRFSHLENDVLFTTATLLDPRYKSKFFGNHTYVKEHVIKNILDMYKEREFYMNSEAYH